MSRNVRNVFRVVSPKVSNQARKTRNQASETSIEKYMEELKIVPKPKNDHLPTDVLYRIFTFLLPTENSPHSIRSNSFFKVAPYNIACVCRVWRDLVLSIPSLWSRSSLLPYRPTRHTFENMTLAIKQHLKRSQDSPPFDVFCTTRRTVLCITLARNRKSLERAPNALEEGRNLVWHRFSCDNWRNNIYWKIRKRMVYFRIRKICSPTTWILLGRRCPEQALWSQT